MLIFLFKKIEKNHISIYCPSSEPTERQKNEANAGLNVVFVTNRAFGEYILGDSSNGLPNVTFPTRTHPPAPSAAPDDHRSPWKVAFETCSMKDQCETVPSAGVKAPEEGGLYRTGLLSYSASLMR